MDVSTKIFTRFVGIPKLFLIHSTLSHYTFFILFSNWQYYINLAGTQLPLYHLEDLQEECVPCAAVPCFVLTRFFITPASDNFSIRRQMMRNCFDQQQKHLQGVVCCLDRLHYDNKKREKQTFCSSR